MHRRTVALHHMKADQEYQNPARYPQCGQSDTEHFKDKAAGEGEHQHDNKGYNQTFTRHRPRHFPVVAVGQAEVDRQAGDRVHNGEKGHERQAELMQVKFQHSFQTKIKTADYTFYRIA